MPLNALDAIQRFESGGRNVRNYMYDSGHTAAGYFQITNSTWRSIAPSAGIDLGQYPTAMSAPYDVQRQAAGALFQRGGFSDWAPYNPRLASFIQQNGGPGNFSLNGDAVPGAGAPQSAGGSSVGPYDFGQGFNAGNMGDPSQGVTTENGTFTPNDVSQADTQDFNWSQLGQKMGITPSPSVPKAIDQQTKIESQTAKANTDKIIKSAQDTYAQIAGSWSDYFVRGAFIIVGLIALAAGLAMLNKSDVSKVMNVKHA